MQGILGGTFDPIHYGHIEPALDLLARLPLEAIRLIPARRSPHRSTPVASAAHRWAMVERAARAHPRLLPDDRELRRAAPSYTVDTLRELRAEQGESSSLCLILGVDAFAGLSAWDRWEEIPRLAHLVVVQRPGAALPSAGTEGELLAGQGVADASALAARPAGAVLVCTLSLLDISSSAIRAAIAGGTEVHELVPTAVWDYIRSHGLYRERPGET